MVWNKPGLHLSTTTRPPRHRSGMANDVTFRHTMFRVGALLNSLPFTKTKTALLETRDKKRRPNEKSLTSQHRAAVAIVKRPLVLPLPFRQTPWRATGPLRNQASLVPRSGPLRSFQSFGDQPREHPWQRLPRNRSSCWFIMGARGVTLTSSRFQATPLTRLQSGRALPAMAPA